MTFLEPVRALKKEYAKITFYVFLEAFFSIGSIWFLEQAVDAVEKTDFGLFKYYLLLYGGAILLFYPLIYLLRYWNWDFIIANKKWIYEKYLKNYIYMDNNEAERIGTGKTIAILDNGVETRSRRLLWSMFRDGSLSFLKILFALIYMTTIIGWNILWVVIVGIVTFLFTHYLNKYAVKYRAGRRDTEHTQMRTFVKIIMSKFEILQGSKLSKEIDNFKDVLNTRYFYHKRVTDYVRAMFYVPIFAIGLATTYFVWMKGTVVLETGKGFGELSALLVIMGMISILIKQILDFYRQFTKERVHFEKLLDVFGGNKRQTGYEEGNPFSYSSGKIIFDNVTYGYNDGAPVFENFSLDIIGSQKTAFVGESGGGKSTLVKLVAGYIKPDIGKILIDEQSIESISLKSYYRNIGYLAQEPSIFDGTIRENLFYAVDREVDQKVVDTVIKQSKCEFIYDLKDGVNTEIGERGVRLSGGQRQRLAIAKIFLKNPKIIILDEPTSALDSFSEEVITQAMNNLFKGRTVIIIAHRLQTVKHADDIIVIEQGKVVERGTHKELVALGGSYAKMLELQSGF